MKLNKLITPFVVLFTLLIAVAVFPTILRGSLPDQQSGVWTAGPQMAHLRAGATATVMYDGRVLVAGGKDENGAALASVDIVDVEGAITTAPAMNVARSGHAAVWLYDGYVLVSGGTTRGGGVTNTAELYDPLSDSWTLLPSFMSDPRTGHTATNLFDGRILIAGGSNGSSALSSVETFSIVDETFSFAGVMDVARQNHAAAGLLDGRVLIVGGANAVGVTLSSTSIFDLETNSIAAGPALNEARQDATATTLLDGNVLVAGGRNPQLPKNGVSELASIELIDMNVGASRTLPITMSVPRANHVALLLADNNQVILAGGETADVPSASVDLYTPWTSELRATGAMENARTSAAGTNLAVPGRAMLVGGSQTNTTAIYAFATVKTDRTDYLPDMPVNIAGTGWVPGEAVHINIVNNGITRMSVDTVANGWGNISDSTFAPVGTDLGETFYLSATGSQSQAQAKFTDGNLTITVTGPGTVNGNPALTPANCTSAGACTVNVGSEVLAATGNYVNSWTGNNKVTITGGCTPGSNSCSFGIGNGSSATMAVVFAPAPTLSNINPTTAAFGYSGTITVTGTGFIPSTTKIVLAGTQLTTTCSSSTSCSATVPARGVGSYAVNVTNGTAANSGTQNLTITQAAASVNLSNLTATYNGSTHAATATTNPVGLATSITYAGSSTPPTNAGSYAVVATITDTNYTGSVTGTLAISKAATTVALSNLSQSYDGTGKSVAVTTSPIGLSTTVTYNGSATLPTAAGTYAVVATITDSNYTGTISGTLTITGVTATVSLSNLTSTYNGSTHATTVTTVPAGLATDVTYDGLPTAPTNAGSFAVVATITDPNYSGSASGTLTIDKAAATIAITNVNQTYNASQKSVTITTTPPNVATTVTYGGSSTAPTNAGSYAVVATLNDSNYTATPANDTLVIAKATSTITINNLSQTFDGSTKPVSVTTAPTNLAITITYDGNAPVPTNVGTYAVVVTSNDPNYTGSASGSLVIAKATATVSLSGLSRTFDGSPKAVTASTVPTGLVTTFTYDGNATTPSAVGSYSVIATVTDSNYAGTGTGTLTIDPAAATIVLGNLTATYDGTAKAVSVTTVPAGLSTSITYGGSPSAPINAGTYPIVATVTDPNHTGSTSGSLSIAKADQTITFGALSSKNLTDTPFTVAASSSSNLPVSFSASGNCSVNGSTVTITDIGNCSITAIQAGNSNHNAAPSVPQSFTVTGGVPTISWAAPQAIVYGTPISATHLNAAATYGGSSLAGTYDYSPAAGTMLGVGVHTLNVTFHPTDSLYNSVNGNVSITVAPATVVVTAPNLARVYGDTNPTANPTYGAFVNGESSTVITAPPNCGSSAIATSHVGTYPITCAGATASNYQFTYAPGVLTVTTAALSVTPNNASRPQGQANPSLTGTITGIRNSDPITATYSTTAITNSPVGPYPITAAVTDGGSGTLANYSVVLSMGTLTVTNTKPDLTEVVLMLTVNPTAGGVIQVSDTVSNIGASTANASYTRFYISNNGTTKVASFGAHDVPPIAAGASYGPTTSSLTLPSNLVGTYFVIACADDVSSVQESNEANNCTATSSFVIAGADLVVTSVSAPTAAVAGSTLLATDVTKNQGGATANASLTRLYLSNNGTTKLSSLGTRDVPVLAASVSSGPVTTTVTLPSTYLGTYYLIACADDVSSVVESVETNNCTASNSFTITGADLVVSLVSVPSTATAGSSMAVTDNTKNQGAASANASWTRFYLSTNGISKLMSVGNRDVPSLAAGVASGPYTTTLSLPTNIAGIFYLIACADDVSSVQESNEANNCTASTAFSINGADLMVGSIIAPTTGTAGTSVSVSETTTNQGASSASASLTRFYLSSTGTNKLYSIGVRSVPSLSAGTNSGPIDTAVALPAKVVGKFYVLGCADDGASVVESSESNNCTASALITIK